MATTVDTPITGFQIYCDLLKAGTLFISDPMAYGRNEVLHLEHYDWQSQSSNLTTVFTWESFRTLDCVSSLYGCRSYILALFIPWLKLLVISL